MMNRNNSCQNILFTNHCHYHDYMHLLLQITASRYTDALLQSHYYLPLQYTFQVMWSYMYMYMQKDKMFSHIVVEV